MERKVIKILRVFLLLLALPKFSHSDFGRLPNFRNLFEFKDVWDIIESIAMSEECKESLKRWLKGIASGEQWALLMEDSMAKFMDGVLMGRYHTPGHYDECIQAHNDEFNGKHCMIKMTFPDNKNNASEAPTFLHGICTPSVCGIPDLNSIVSKLGELYSLNVQNLTENDCSNGDFQPFRTEDWVTISVIAILLLLTLGSTLYEAIEKFIYKNEKPKLHLCSFSLITNWKTLFTISHGYSQLKCLHGIRFFSMCWVILAHSYLTYVYAFPLNFNALTDIVHDKTAFIISNSVISVDTFFFLSGLLLCIVFFRDISTKGCYDVPVAYIHRYVRLTPPFAFLMLVQATIISRMGNGPLWINNMERAENDCRSSWWSALLYVQNYVNTKTMCLGQSWYLSADMQMFWLSPFFLYPMLWWPSFAPFFLLFLTLVAAMINFAVAFINELTPNFTLSFESIHEKQFEMDYVPFHTRMAPWIIGLATGYVICGLQAKKIRINISQFWIITAWVVGLGIGGASLVSISRFISSEWTFLEASFYISFHRVGWALGLSWIVIACVSGNGGPINAFLSLNIFQPLGKLCYCSYLIHMTLQNYRLYSSRTNQYVRHYEVMYSFLGDLYLSFLISIPICLITELPFMLIDKYFLRKLEIFPFPKVSKKLQITSEKAKNDREKSEEIKLEMKQVEEKGKDNSCFISS